MEIERFDRDVRPFLSDSPSHRLLLSPSHSRLGI
jgi:hypothetical protein